MSPSSHQPAAAQPTDPAVDTAAPEGWRRWAADLGNYDKERIAGFGGFIAGGFVLSVLCLYVFAWLAQEVMSAETTAIDAAAFALLQQFSSPTTAAVMRAISFMGSEGVLAIGVLLLTLFLVQRRWGALVIVVMVSGGAQVLNDALKTAFHRTRPAPVLTILGPQQWSFPSGHAMISAAFYFYVGYMVWRLVRGPWRVILIAGLALLVLLIGISRIYLQAHYLSDVIAGYLAGVLWTLAVIIGSHILVARGVPRLPGQRQRAAGQAHDVRRAA